MHSFFASALSGTFGFVEFVDRAEVACFSRRAEEPLSIHLHLYHGLRKDEHSAARMLKRLSFQPKPRMAFHDWKDFRMKMGGQWHCFRGQDDQLPGVFALNVPELSIPVFSDFWQEISEHPGNSIHQYHQLPSKGICLKVPVVRNPTFSEQNANAT